MNDDRLIQIIDALNTQGRQGPQSLLSDECYSWVSSMMDISRQDYEELIKQHTIDDAMRHDDRTAYFTRLDGGRVTLFKSNEAEFRPYVCLAIELLDPPVTSARLIKAVKAIYPGFTPVDMMPQKNLSSYQIREMCIRDRPRCVSARLSLCS